MTISNFILEGNIIFYYVEGSKYKFNYCANDRKSSELHQRERLIRDRRLVELPRQKEVQHIVRRFLDNRHHTCRNHQLPLVDVQ